MKSTSTDAYAQFLDQLVGLRKQQGVTQAELSKKLGKPQPFVSNIERGVRRVDVIEFYAIVRALGGEPEEAFAKLVRGLPKRVRI